jgi:hypothetical protein
VLPTYNKTLGVLVYQHGWSAVIACLPGDGTNGLRYEKAGRKKSKSRAHDAFAAVANHLVERGVTDASKIVAAGASDGVASRPVHIEIPVRSRQHKAPRAQARSIRLTKIKSPILSSSVALATTAVSISP